LPESIPVAPGKKPEDAADPEAESQDPGEGFDDDILADIERSLDENASLGSGQLGEKVELDKADLPLIWDEEDEEEEEPEPEPEEPQEVEVDLAGEEEPPPEPVTDLDLDDKPAGKSLKYWLIVGGAGLLLLFIMGGGLAYLSGAFDSPPEETVPVAEDLPPYMFEGVVPDPIKGLRLDLKPFTVPLQRSKKGRILTAVVSLEVAEPGAKQGIISQEKLCRDVIYRLLRNRPAAVLETARAKRLLHAQIKAGINAALKRDLVFGVYFTEFVITG
jgi:flagellar basal body-associated protein FliL